MGRVHAQRSADVASQEWADANGCALHDTRRALKRSVQQHIRDSDLPPYMYIGAQSLRNSYCMFYKFMPSWRMAHIDLADEATLWGEDMLQLLLDSGWPRLEGSPRDAWEHGRGVLGTPGMLWER